MFERRHYEFLAGWARAMALPPAALDTLADALARDNPHFNRKRFLLACGITPAQG